MFTCSTRWQATKQDVESSYSTLDALDAEVPLEVRPDAVACAAPCVALAAASDAAAAAASDAAAVLSVTSDSSSRCRYEHTKSQNSNTTRLQTILTDDCCVCLV